MAKPKKKYSNFSKEEIDFVKKTLCITKKEEIDKTILKELKEKLKKLKDSRMKNKIVYKFWDVIICVIVASFADNNTWEEIHSFIEDNYNWFKSFLQMSGGIPSAKTIERIMAIIDSDELNNILKDFFISITFKKFTKYEFLNFDGRVNNGSKRKATLFNDEKLPLNCLNVYSNKLGYCIHTVPIDNKTNEIPTIESLLKKMDLTGIIVTWDALNTQVNNVKAVIESNGDYIVPIKANQGNFYKDLQLYFNDTKCEEIIAGNSESKYFTHTEKSHSQIIKYECFETSDINWYNDLQKWMGVKSFGMVKKSTTKKVLVKNTRKNANDKDKKIEKVITTVEIRYYISSRFVDINEFYIATREHWGVENKIHWHLDFTFCQDNNSTLNKNALLNLEIIHKFVLAILERVKSRYKKSLKSIRKHISNNAEEFFPELICALIANKQEDSFNY